MTQIPLNELWNDHGALQASRACALTSSDLAVVLRTRQILHDQRYAVADLGRKLQWLDATEFVQFWESEARGRIVDDEQFSADDYPSGYCYVVSEWRDVDSDMPILLFERYH